MSTLTPEQKVKIAKSSVDFVDALLTDGFDKDDVRRWVEHALSGGHGLTAPRRREAHAMLAECASVFRDYERLHLGKEPPDTAKAQRNAAMAARCEAVGAGAERLSRELREAKTRAEFAEAGIPGLIFSKRKALVERCAQIVEEYARKAGEDRAYMLKGPALWLRDIATAVRERGMGPATDG